MEAELRIFIVVKVNVFGDFVLRAVVEVADLFFVFYYVRRFVFFFVF